ncbi:hypothetical protein E5288_WYG005688 [Bos mutus]|uniref:Uncharacterized protein n=1 Tax=Bos mutus TaxID=72004 RepID=A0A6B0RUX8_9CETA|nr:hypothetical protein [Bos mutus]
MHDNKESPQAEGSVLQLGLRFATEFSQQAQQHPGGQQRDSGIREKTTLQGKKPKLQGETLRCLKALQPQACSEWRSGDEIRRTMHSALKLPQYYSVPHLLYICIGIKSFTDVPGSLTKCSSPDGDHPSAVYRSPRVPSRPGAPHLQRWCPKACA